MADKAYMFRALTAGDIDVRVAQAKENGVVDMSNDEIYEEIRLARAGRGEAE